MSGKLALCVMLVVLLCGFTSESDRLKDQLGKMPQHYSQFDMKLGWAVTAEQGGTVINGVVQNVRYAFMEDIEVWVAAQDAAGKTVARGVQYILPRRLDRDDVASFRVELPAALAAGSTLLFTYKYLGSDGSLEGDGTNWMQSFEAKLPAGK